MKTNFSTLVQPVPGIWVLACIIILSLCASAQVPQIINYQGRVLVGVTNFEGSGQFKFALVNATGTTTYWSNDATSVAGSQPTAAVALTVTKGLYSVLLGDTSLTNMTAIPATAFNNSDVRLRVWFNDGTNGSQLLTPDQRIVSVGYAVIAGNVSDGAITSAKIAPNAVGATQISAGAIGTTQLANNAVTSANISNGAVGTSKLATNAVGTANIALPLSLNGSGTVLSVTSSDDTAVSAIGGFRGVYGFAANGYGIYGGTNNSIGVWGSSSSSGDGVYGSSAVGYGVHGQGGLAGVYGFGTNTYGVLGETSIAIGVWGKSNSSGDGVYGSSTTGIGVRGLSTSGSGIYGKTSIAASNFAGVFGENTAAGGNGVIGVAANTNSTGVAGVADLASSIGVYGRGSGWGGYFEGNVAVTGYESFGSTTRQMIDLWGTSYGIGVQSGVLYERGNGFAWFVGGTHNDGSFNPGAGGSTLMTLDSFGHLSVKVLTINGADVAEPFQVAENDLPKGSVLIIDEKNPGQLKLSDSPYDKRVAGILSGANGIRAGICLSQQGFNEGGQNVALSGRVYVLADASDGPIKPGDLLTTSATPGHAMKATQHDRAQGAIIGKAMSSLEEGHGMVLVLVTLQ